MKALKLCMSFPLFSVVSVEHLSFEVYPYSGTIFGNGLCDQIMQFSNRNLLTTWKQMSVKDLFFFKYQVENGVYVASPLQERTILMRKEGESAKSINEMLLSRLSRYRASPSATLAALTGSTISNTLKEDQAGMLPLTYHLLAWLGPFSQISII